MHVIGGIGGDPDRWDRCLVPLTDSAGQVGAVVLAVPYVHEWRLGVRTTDLDKAAVRAAFRDRFAEVYTTLCDRAQERWPGVPLVGMGHLTMGKTSRDDYPHEIHQVGTIDALPDSVLDHRMQYVALGHIHRSYPVADRRAWYSGSPIAMSLPEAATTRRVLVVELADQPDGTAAVQKVDVPAFRRLLKLQGTPDDLVAQVGAVPADDELPPLLFCHVEGPTFPVDLSGRIQDALAPIDEAHRPALVELRPAEGHGPGHRRAGRGRPTVPRRAHAQPGLRASARRPGTWRRRRAHSAFSTLASARPAELEQMIARIKAGGTP